MTTTIENDAVAVARAGFDAFGRGDLPGFIGMWHEDATWNHRNPDRLGGVHAGSDAIVAFLKESGRLTAGTLRAVPEAFMSDAAGHVAAIMRVSGTRPDGRTLDDRQILLLTIEDGLVRSADQYIGDPPAVTAFWA